MKKTFILFMCLCNVLLISSCSNYNNEAKQKATILQLLNRERTAHFARDVNMFISEFSDSMISVNRGVVKVTSPDSSKGRIGHYFKNTSFIKWDDAAPPVIRFSDDMSMAYAVVQKEVITLTKDSSGTSVIDTTHFAWTSIYQKHDDEWKITCNTSTNK